MPGFAIQGGAGPSNVQETLRSNRWVVQQLGPITDTFSLKLAKDLQLPNFNVTQETHTGGSLVYKYAKEINYQDVTISFYDFQGFINTLDEWRKMIWTPEDGLKDAGTYKAESKFQLLKGDGEVVHTYVLKNSWPKKIGHGQLSYSSSEIKYVQVILAYDWIVLS